MTYNIQPGGPQYYAPLPYEPPTAPLPPLSAPLPPVKKSRGPWVWIIAAVLLLTGGGTTAVLVATSGPTLEDAKSQCLTAFDAEMTDRNNSGEESSLIISTITDISVTDSVETAKGYVVYGRAKYEIMGIYTGTTHGSVMLKCTANENTAGEFNTTVENR